MPAGRWRPFWAAGWRKRAVGDRLAARGPYGRRAANWRRSAQGDPHAIVQSAQAIPGDALESLIDEAVATPARARLMRVVLDTTSVRAAADEEVWRQALQRSPRAPCPGDLAYILARLPACSLIHDAGALAPE